MEYKLPENPGCYIMKNKFYEIIYIGKAKNIKNRVSSYFNNNLNIKTELLVSEIKEIEYIITKSEKEALILEQNLIKKHKPKYNILLKDDKTYPYLKLTKEKHPRLEIVRKIKKDKSDYFGPYPNNNLAFELKQIIDNVFKLRKCDKLPKKECLYYHLGTCFAPCIKKDTEMLERKERENIRSFLNGNLKEVREILKNKMENASEKLNFELANKYKKSLVLIEDLKEKQKINSNDLKNKDYFYFEFYEKYMSVQIFNYRLGNMIERKKELYEYLREEKEEVESYIYNYYELNNKPKDIYVSYEMDYSDLNEILNINIKVPKKGINKKILDMASENSKENIKINIIEKQKKEEKINDVLNNLSRELKLDNLSNIEMFDNSNIQGTNAISAMISCKNGKFSKKDYRKFNIKTVEGPDDYASMYEVIYRRYLKLKKDSKEYPSAIFVDGGKGQLTAGMKALKNLDIDIPIFAIAKDSKHKTSHIINKENDEIHFEKNSSEYKFLYSLQEEVHRFAIDFFRQKHKSSSLKSSFDNIKGIGPKKRSLLQSKYKNLEELKKATEEELLELKIGKNIIKEIKNLKK